MAEFNQEKAGKIQVETTNYPSEEELEKALLNGNTYPDVAIIDNRWQSELVGKGVLSPVIDHMNKIGSSIRIMYKADTPKPIYQSCFQDDIMWTAAFHVIIQLSWLILISFMLLI